MCRTTTVGVKSEAKLDFFPCFDFCYFVTHAGPGLLRYNMTVAYILLRTYLLQVHRQQLARTSKAVLTSFRACWHPTVKKQ